MIDAVCDGTHCAMCGSTEPLVKSHVYPQWMGRRLRGGSPYLLGVSESFGTRFDNENGEWDRIVCRRCEDSFNTADRYFYAFFDRLEDGEPVILGDQPGWAFREADAAMIQRFALTCLYRAALSSRYPAVNLGPRLNEIGDILRAPPTLSPRFPALLFVERHHHSDVIIYPGVQRIDDVRFYRMVFPSLSMNVQVDSRPTPRGLRPLVLTTARPVVALKIGSPPPSTMSVLHRATNAHRESITRMTRRLHEKND